jgi:hypothetical protein
MILYAVGRERPLFAVVEVTSEVHSSGNADWPNQVAIRYEVGPLPVENGVRLEDAFGGNLLGAIQFGHSYIELTEAQYTQAAHLLHEAAGIALQTH